MSSSHQMTDYVNVCAFIFAGKATFTIVSKATQTRFTFKVTRKENEFKGKTYVRHFVALMNGPDNENSFAYMGFFRPGEGYVHGGDKAKISADAPGAKAFAWFAKGVLSEKGVETLGKVEFWHEGMCCKCGRKLTVPSSIASGIGPECAKFFAAAA